MSLTLFALFLCIKLERLTVHVSHEICLLLCFLLFSFVCLVWFFFVVFFLCGFFKDRCKDFLSIRVTFRTHFFVKTA